MCLLSIGVPCNVLVAAVACSAVLYSTKAYLVVSVLVARDHQGPAYPSVLPSSFVGMNMASSLVFPAASNFFSTYLMSFDLFSSGTIGKPSMTTKASRPSSSRTSYCSFKSDVLQQVDHQRKLVLDYQRNLFPLLHPLHGHHPRASCRSLVPFCDPLLRNIYVDWCALLPSEGIFVMRQYFIAGILCCSTTIRLSCGSEHDGSDKTGADSPLRRVCRLMIEFNVKIFGEDLIPFITKNTLE